MSQILVKNVRKTAETTEVWPENTKVGLPAATTQQLDIFKKLGLGENGKILSDNRTQESQEEERSENLKTIRNEHLRSNLTSSVNRRHVPSADDEGFEETHSSSSSSKPMFVHLSLKDHLRDLQCDLFDDCDLT